MAPTPLFSFDRYRLDERERQLLLGTEVVPLAPKLFDLLLVFVRRPGRLLQKPYLLDLVWPGVAVEEGSLTRGVSSLRQALGPTADGRDFIQTVSKRGYRFVAPVRELVDDGSETASAGIALPRTLLVPAAVEFVGRDAELSQMQDVWQRAKGGRHQLLLVAGEPGIGKTRLALEFARRHASDATTVLVGCCDEENLVPYQPFVEALTWYIRHCPETDLRAELAAIGGGSELASLVPDLRRRLPDVPSPPAVYPEGQRYRLFETVAAMIAVASSEQPLLLIADDLHWADKPTLLLLRHIIRSARPARFVIVATYRESELSRTHPLAETLAALRREPGVTRLALHGLDAAHVSALVDSIVGPNAPAHLSRAVMDRTEGNPFFATEMLRHLKESGAIDVPEGIKEVIGRRLSRLSDACNRVLGLAAVIGREFDATLLEAVADLPEPLLLDGLDEATRAQLITESRDVNGRFTFRHALIRETLYSELSSPRRVKLHRRVADAIERLAPNMPIPPLAELARHFSQAASANAADKTIDYAMRAGDRAAEGLAHEEAARLYDLALQALDFKPAAAETEQLRVDLHARRARSFDAVGQWSMEVRELEMALHHLDAGHIERRCEFMLALARASFLLLDVRPVERYATDALQLAEQLQRDDLAANAIAWLARCRQVHGDLGGAIDMDRNSMSRAPGVTTAAHMLGTLTLYLAGRSTEAIPLVQEAADAARSSGDITFVMYALTHAGLNMAATGRYTEASQAFHEVRSFGRKYGALPMLARATAMAGGLHLTLFDFEGAEALQSEARELGRSAGFAPPIVSAGIDSLLTLARRHDPGRAEHLLEETAAAAASTGGWHQWLWQLRLIQARAELALAREAFDEAVQTATDSIAGSRARSRPKYETFGLITRARGQCALGRTGDAIADAAAAVRIAERIGDPALLLVALDALLELDGTDDMAVLAGTVAARIDRSLPDDVMRQCFRESEVVQRVRARAGARGVSFTAPIPHTR
jgi:DNA-binding winged helix-turn-helix (wHTH) protein/tetratricopeptide (TPR) repeat protein